MGRKTSIVIERFVRWSSDCGTAECLRELYAELEAYEALGRRTPRGERVYDLVREQIREEASRGIGEMVWNYVRKRWEEEGRRGYLWFQEEGARVMAKAFVEAIEQGLRGREAVEHIMEETGRSIVAVRHFLYELARFTGSEEVTELAREARRIERERYGR